ncbi:MAG: sulfatase-like hydrolase/transferase [Pirellulales bacterium]
MKQFVPKLIVSLGLLSIGISNSLVADAKRPNILFIYSDDHSHRTVSCYPEAYAWANTPNIDKLAKQGVRFTHAYVGTWCMPSRASMLTGHHQYGVESMRMEGTYPGSAYDPEKCPFWPKVFRANGYTTAHLGKWHTGIDTGAGRDWDYQKVWNRPRHTGNAGNYYDGQLIETDGGKAVLTPGYTTDMYTQWADEFIRGDHRDAKKPWYLWLCFGAVHAPFTPAERHLDDYNDVKVETPKDIYPPRPGKPDYMQKLAHWIEGPDGEPILNQEQSKMKTIAPMPGLHGDTLTHWVRQYHQGVLAIDDAVGKLVKTLKETKQYDNTLIVFTSDQGFAWGQHGLRHKLAPYDASVRSPMIISMPSQIESGKVCRRIVAGVDLIPTIFAFAGLELPWKMHGHDLTPLLKDPTAKWDHPTLLTLTGRKYGSDTDVITDDPEELYLGGIPWWVFLAKGRYKYIRTLVDDQVEELYDLKNDPEELDNLAVKPEHQKLLARYRNNLLKELRRTDAGMVKNLPSIKTLDSK